MALSLPIAVSERLSIYILACVGTALHCTALACIVRFPLTRCDKETFYHGRLVLEKLYGL